MCGRFTPIPRPQVLEEFHRLFDIEVAETIGPPPAEEGELTVAGQCLPFHDVDALHAAADGQIIMRPMQWQLIHNWNREFRSDYTNFNTRREKLGKPHNRDLLRYRRCIVPVGEFFENRKEGGRTVQPKQSYRFTLRGQSIIPLGGIYSVWINPEDESDRRYSCSVITMDPNELIAEIHNRMPFIVPPAAVKGWLDRGIDDFDEVIALVQPYDPGLMERQPEGALF